jgi:hypothetical protein
MERLDSLCARIGTLNLAGRRSVRQSARRRFMESGRLRCRSSFCCPPLACFTSRFLAWELFVPRSSHNTKPKCAHSSAPTPTRSKLPGPRAVEQAGGRKITAAMVKAAIAELDPDTPAVSNGESWPSLRQTRQLVDTAIGELLVLLSQEASHCILSQKVEAPHSHIQALFVRRDGSHLSATMRPISGNP